MYKIKYLKYKHKYLELKNNKYVDSQTKHKYLELKNLKNLIGGYGENPANEYYSDRPLIYFNDFELKTYSLNKKCDCESQLNCKCNIRYFDTRQAVQRIQYDYSNTIDDIKSNVAHIEGQDIDDYYYDHLIIEDLIGLDQPREKIINDILVSNTIPQNDTYLICGHGCSTDESWPIPENCQYVTVGICGETTNLKQLSGKIKLFLRYKDIFENPKDNIFQLKKLFGDNINVHYYEPSDIDYGYNTYKNSLYTMMIDYIDDKSEEYEIYTSGLIRSGSHEEKTEFNRISKKIGMTQSDIETIYKYSCFPTPANIISLLTNTASYHRTGEIFSIDQKTLFTLLPGTYYNFVCRNPCDVENRELRHGIDLRRQKSVEGSTRVMGHYRTTSLHELCKSPQNDLTKSLINRQEINIRDEEGRTPLFYLVGNNSIDNITFLLTFNPELNYKDSEGNTLLHLAARNNLLEIVNLLLEKENINVNRVNNDFNTPLHLACMYNPEDELEKCKNEEIIYKLLAMEDINKSINLQNTNGNTPAHLTYKDKYAIFVKLISRKDINKDLENNEDQTINNIISNLANQALFASKKRSNNIHR